MNRNTKRMMYITMLIAMSVLLHFVESLIPIPVPILGVKLGFANIISLITFYMFGFPVMVGVNVARVIMASLLRGVLFGTPFWMSVAGVTLSTIAIGIAGHFLKEGNEVIVSVCSSIAHIVGQIIMAYFIMGTTLIFYYFPIMLLLSIPTGIFTGVIARQVLKRIGKSFRKDL